MTRNFICSVIKHERVVTTLAKAKALRPYAALIQYQLFLHQMLAGRQDAIEDLIDDEDLVDLGMVLGLERVEAVHDVGAFVQRRQHDRHLRRVTHHRAHRHIEPFGDLAVGRATVGGENRDNSSVEIIHVWNYCTIGSVLQYDMQISVSRNSPRGVTMHPDAMYQMVRVHQITAAAKRGERTKR